jgi:VanZ family protein
MGRVPRVRGHFFVASKEDHRLYLGGQGARMTIPIDTTAPPRPIPRQGGLSRLHCLAFALLLVAWTVALLSPVPQAAKEALGGERGAFWFGKCLHVGTYAFLAIFGGTLRLSRRWRFVLLGVLSLHAFATEFFQEFVGRGASWRDVGLDHVGILLGIAVSWKWWRQLLAADAAPDQEMPADEPR